MLVQRKPGNKPRGLKENVFSYWMTYLPKCQVPTWRRKMRAMQIAALTQKAWSKVMIVMIGFMIYIYVFKSLS